MILDITFAEIASYLDLSNFKLSVGDDFTQRLLIFFRFSLGILVTGLYGLESPKILFVTLELLNLWRSFIIIGVLAFVDAVR